MFLLLVFLAASAPVQSARAASGPLPPATAPPGLVLELRTAANETTFRLSETIPLEIVYRSAKPATYAIELADGWNHVAHHDRFLIQPGERVIDRRVELVGVTCCKSRRPYLRTTPAIYPYELTDFARFTEPGEYRVQFVTRRVFKGNKPGFDPSSLTVRSNVLKITILPDDPQWLDDALQQTLRAAGAQPSFQELRPLLEPPPPGSLERPHLSERVRRYLDVRRKLGLLDTPAAIRERVARLQMPSAEEWRASWEANGNGYSGIDHAVACSGRPDLIAEALAKRAASPEFGVSRGYVELWAQVLVERDHPEMVRLLPENERRDWKTYVERLSEAKRDLLVTLRRLNNDKSGVAAEITSVTIGGLAAELSK